MRRPSRAFLKKDGAPDNQPCVCSKCSAVTRKKDPNMNGCFKYSSRFYCRRHHFYVHSGGYCPAFGSGPFVDTGKPQKPPVPCQSKCD